jgi:hypothetical protein
VKPLRRRPEPPIEATLVEVPDPTGQRLQAALRLLLEAGAEEANPAPTPEAAP